MTNQSNQAPQVSMGSGALGAFLLIISILITIGLPFINTYRDQYGNGYKVYNGDILDYLTLPMFLVTLFLAMGFKIIEPKEARVLVLFGKAKGVLMENGFFWINPFVKSIPVSLKIENSEAKTAKVNDKTGSPIMASAVVSAQVSNPEAFCFNADNPRALIMNGIDRALRKIVSLYPYDIATDTEGKANEGNENLCLRDDNKVIAERFKTDLQETFSQIGMEVIDANFTNLSYAPEIASVMLQRQQASALMDSRKILVASTVSTVKDAIKAMEDNSETQPAIKMDEKTKAMLAANLLIVMVGERGAQVTIPLS